MARGNRVGLRHKRVGPHTIRHTTATHLLRAGVDINTIRAWLGHVSINTTNIYAETDLEMKPKPLACVQSRASDQQSNLHTSPTRRAPMPHDLGAYMKERFPEVDDARY